MSRVVTLLLALLALGAVTASPALAGTNPSLERGRKEIRKASELVDTAFQSVKDGKRKLAYDQARTAYLDHFEFVEVPLRLRNPNLVLDSEFVFAKFRNQIRSGASIGDIRETVRILRGKLLDIDRELGKKGVAAPAVAFAFSFTILFREGVEAVLLIAILLGSLAAGSASNYKKPLGMGVAAAGVATVVMWIVATLVIDIAPLNRELLEAVTALVAVVVLIGVSFWLVQRLEHKRRMEFMRARVAGAMAVGSAAAFAGLGFTAVFREGFETVLFYQALALFAQGLELWVVLGAVTAAIALGLVAWAILKTQRKLPLKPLLIGGASLLLLLSVAFTGNAIRSLQSADLIGVHPTDGFRLPVFLAELTGIHPTVESLLTQLAMVLVFAAGAAYVFAWQPRREKRRVARASAARTATPAGTT